MSVQQFNSDADRREYERWVKAMMASKDAYGWIRWADAPPPAWQTVEMKRDCDPSYVKPEKVKVESLGPQFNVAGVLWR